MFQQAGPAFHDGQGAAVKALLSAGQDEFVYLFGVIGGQVLSDGAPHGMSEDVDFLLGQDFRISSAICAMV